MKTCPVCNARCFEDMDVCYGCLHHFDTTASGSMQAPIETPNAHAPTVTVDDIPPSAPTAAAQTPATNRMAGGGPVQKAPEVIPVPVVHDSSAVATPNGAGSNMTIPVEVVAPKPAGALTANTTGYRLVLDVHIEPLAAP